MPPVATPNVTFSKERIAIGSPVKVTYRFQVAANAKFDGDYWVFVHVLNPQGELLWNDDHLPSKPTSQWMPGQTIEYTRTIFVPNYPHVGEAQVRIGLYSQADGKRLVLAAPEASRREYNVAKIELLPQSENVFLIYKEGWHPAEIASENPMSEWQWTQKRATFSFRNPKKDANFYLEYDARSDLPTTTRGRRGRIVAAWTSPNQKERQCAPHQRGIWPPGWVAGVPHTGRQPRSAGWPA